MSAAGPAPEHSKKSYRPSSSTSQRPPQSARPTTAEYDRALQEDIMEHQVDVENPNQARFGGHHSATPKQLKIIIAGGIVLFVVAFTAVLMVDSIHTIDEGNVGIYFVQGALDDRYSTPGVHWSVPFVTSIVEVKIRPQTETLEAISTVTRDGIQNTFHNIQVLSNVEVDQLIPLIKKFGVEFKRALVYDRVSEELRTFCANHSIDEVCTTG